MSLPSWRDVVDQPFPPLVFTKKIVEELGLRIGPRRIVTREELEERRRKLNKENRF